MIKTLIVDDEVLSRELLKNLIKKIKVPLSVVGEATNGEDAIKLIFKLNPELVFLDIEMPENTGIDVMQYINEKYRNSITFIVVTAFNYFEYAQASLRLGARDILLKPVDILALEESISRAIGYKITDAPLLNEILAYISVNYKEDIRLNECSQKFYIGVNQINKLFKEHFNMTFIKYLNSFRINKALELIENEDLTIKEIGYEVGFNNLNYFYKTFKNITGNTPKSFRK